MGDSSVKEPEIESRTPSPVQPPAPPSPPPVRIPSPVLVSKKLAEEAMARRNCRFRQQEDSAVTTPLLPASTQVNPAAAVAIEAPITTPAAVAEPITSANTSPLLSREQAQSKANNNGQSVRSRQKRMAPPPPSVTTAAEVALTGEC